MSGKMVIPPAWVMTIPNQLQRFFSYLSQKLQPGSMAVFEKVLEVYATYGMALVAELGIPDYLVGGPKSVIELADKFNLDSDALYRLLRALASRGIFRESRGRIFGNTALSRALAEIDGSMKYMVLSHMNPNILAMFGNFRYSLETGKSAARNLFGTDVFSFLESQPREHEQFARAMDNTSVLSSPVILAAVNFAKYQHVVDIGGGLGTMLEAILEMNSGLRGTLFDRPQTIEKARNALANSAVGSRMTCIGGDFFSDHLPSGDVYFLKNIIHDWNDADAIRLLSQIRQVIPPHGRLILVDFVIPRGNQPFSGKLSDLLMLAGLDGARERSAAEFRCLLAQGGFRLVKIKKTVAPFSIITGRPF